MKHFTVCVYMFQKLLIQKSVVSLKTKVDIFQFALFIVCFLCLQAKNALNGVSGA